MIPSLSPLPLPRGAGRPIDEATLEDLRRIVGPTHVLTTDGDVEPYSRDATPLFRARPGVVVLPASTGEVSAVLRLATERGIPVTPRGAGSNLAAATIPEHGGIVLVLTRMTSITEISPDELLAVVEAGVTTAELADACAALGLLYAPDPGSRTVSTVAGNVAMCAGGLRGLKYGVTRNYVLGLEAVLPTGEVIRTGGRLWKDVAGYDLTRLLTGSEGTLAVITEVTVGLLPTDEFGDGCEPCCSSDRPMHSPVLPPVHGIEPPPPGSLTDGSDELPVVSPIPAPLLGAVCGTHSPL